MKQKKKLIFIILSIIVLILFFSGYSMGKGYSNTTLKVKAEIAKPILIVENSSIVEIDGKKQIECYDFKIKNYRENGKNKEITRS